MNTTPEVTGDEVLAALSIEGDGPFGEDDYAVMRKALTQFLQSRTSPPSSPVVAPVGAKRLIGWRSADYTMETADPDMAKNWANNVDVLPIFEGDPNTKLVASRPPQAAVVVDAGGVVLPELPEADYTLSERAGVLDNVEVTRTFPVFTADQVLTYARTALASTLPQKDDSAGAGVEGVQPAKIYVCARECDNCCHTGINDDHATDSACGKCDWSGPSPELDECPQCGCEGSMVVACPKCGGRYRCIAEDFIKALAAQPKAPEPGPVAVGCLNAAHMGEHACKNRNQCWEPCGELGHSAELARVATPPGGAGGSVGADSFNSAVADSGGVPALSVWYGKMPESCGRNNWTALLYNADKSENFTIDRSEYPHRVRYEADRMRHIIGELAEAPYILDYDPNERTMCHLCGGSGEKDGKPCHGLKFDGTAHIAPQGQDSVNGAQGEVQKALKSAFDEGYQFGHRDGMEDCRPMGGRGHGLESCWEDSETRAAILASKGEPS